MTRQEHLDWCKRRALEYVDAGDLMGGVSSLLSDLGKHPETEHHIGIQLGLVLQMTGELSTAGKMRSFIKGFN